MDIEIVIKDDVLRGIVTSMLLAVVGGFFVVIIQSAREGVTVWLYKHFPKNRGKLYVMATSRAGSYLDVLGLLNLLGGFPMFAVLLLMTIGILGQTFSGLVVSTKNISTDFCTSTGCFSTGFGQNPLEGYDNATNILPAETREFSSMNNFVLQSLNNTIASGLPWAGNPRRLTAANFPPEIHKVPLERLSRRVEFTGIYDTVQIYGAALRVDYANGTSFLLSAGVTEASNYTEVYDGWSFGDDIANATNGTFKVKPFYLSTNTTAGIALLLGTSSIDGFGNVQSIQEARDRATRGNNTDITRTTYYGLFAYQSWLAIIDLTFRAQSAGKAGRLELSIASNVRQVNSADSTLLFSAVLTNLNANLRVLGNHSRELQAVFRQQDAMSSIFENGDLLSYVATCYAMAVSQTRPIGMIKGYEQAGIITPAISIKLVLAIPLLLVTIAFLVPYAIVTIKLYTNNDNWLSYKLHVDAREYIINLCHSRFIVNRLRDDDEVLKIIREDHGDDGPIFELGELDV
ncbi:hypothetical protein KI688_007949 [Linnemannia hyalina]|uniref:Uncharacterized protein n=1 Tax=Linnemannia hyalina TaxID=64524 RepID=A0A9P8BM77_9FUNG|nr:hypothetical protein KI688_007949 [Linnemannia hyalina]